MALRRAIVMAIIGVLATTGVAFAAFTATLESSGTANEAEIRAFVKSIKEMRKLDATQLRIFEVAVDEGGTGWHTHPDTPSLVIVEPGADIAYLAPDGAGGCVTRILKPGEMVFHPSSVHDFRAVDATPSDGADAVFTVLYFSAPGVAPLTNAAERAC